MIVITADCHFKFVSWNESRVTLGFSAASGVWGKNYVQAAGIFSTYRYYAIQQPIGGPKSSNMT